MSSAYHPQSDGATERANRTVTQMLRQCVSADQKNWVPKLPAIEFAINSARSESTGFAPFMLNNGRIPRSMVWNSSSKNEYPSVKTFARLRRLAILAAHDSILDARVKQIRAANRKRRFDPFRDGDLVYVSTKNLTFEKGLARKLIPKYIGPYLIEKDYGNHSFRVGLPSHFVKRGVHPVFHSSLLRIHVPNDDRRFPGRLDSQLAETPDAMPQWRIEKILSHFGKSAYVIFEVLWSTGDKTWLPLLEVQDLPCLKEYLELMDVHSVHALPKGTGEAPEEVKIELGIASISFSGVSKHGNFQSDSLLRATELGKHSKIPYSSRFTKMPTGQMASHNEWPDRNRDRDHSPSPDPMDQTPVQTPVQTPAHTPVPHTTAPPVDKWIPVFDRISPECLMVYETKTGPPFIVAAQQVREYIILNHEVRKYYNQDRDDKPTTVIGYSRFASIFNRVFPEDGLKLAYFDTAEAVGDDVPVRGLSGISPTFDDLNINLPNIVSGPVLSPGHIQIPEVEYRQLMTTSAAYSKITLNGIAKAQKSKAEKKMAAAAAERARSGLGGFHLSKHRS